MDNQIMLGFDYQLYCMLGLKIPLYAPIESHLIIVGGSNSGKSTAVLYWLYKLKRFKQTIYIVDFKNSTEFEHITDHYGVFEESYAVIKGFYDEFLSTPEGGGGALKILIIDEIAGLLAHYSMRKDTKEKAEEIRNIMSMILMMGRSKRCFLWLSMQRYTATIFPSSSGSADNFHISVGLGNLSVDGRKGLFAGEHFRDEDSLRFGQGKGIVLVDGQPLRSLIIPKVSKIKLRDLIRST